MFENWPSLDELKRISQQSHEHLQRAAVNRPGTSVYNLSVPTVAGNFGLTVSAFGVVMLYFPGANDAAVLERFNRFRLQHDTSGRKRAIEAGLDVMGYLLGKQKHLRTEVDLSMVPPFQATVYRALRSIPFGEPITCSELAQLAGHPGAASAVGRAVRQNPAPLFIPCHRVITRTGRLGGWSGPRGWKEQLLIHEGISWRY